MNEDRSCSLVEGKTESLKNISAAESIKPMMAGRIPISRLFVTGEPLNFFREPATKSTSRMEGTVTP